MIEQGKFDFDRGDRLALLDAVPIESGKTRDGKSLVSVHSSTALSVLRQIESHARSTGLCWASAQTIATETRLTERTVRRAINRLEDLQFVIVQRREGRSSQVAINWGEVSLQASKAKRRQPNPGHFRANPGHSYNDPGHSYTNPGHSVRRSVTNRKEASSPFIPRPSAAVTRSVAIGASADGWAAVEELFLKLPADRLPTAWQSAVAAAKRASVDPDYVTRVLQHYVSSGNAYSPGALVQRLRRAHPGVDPVQGWPSPSEPSKPRPSGPDHREVVGQVEYRIVREGRKRGMPDDAIAREIVRQLSLRGIDPLLSDWSKRTGNNAPTSRPVEASCQ